MTELETLLYSLESRLLQPAVRHEAHEVATLLSDDFYEFGSSGKLWTKAAIIDAIQDEPPIEREVTEFKVLVMGPDAALVTYRIKRTEPGALPITSLRSSLWVKESGEWRMRFHQGTAVPRGTGRLG